MNLLVSYIVFAVASFITFYIPGRVLISFVEQELSKLEKPVFSIVLGIALFIAATYFLSFFGASQLYFGVIGVSAFYYFWKIAKHESVGKLDLPLVLIIFFGSLTFLSLSFFSGLETTGGMSFVGLNFGDAILHTAIIKNLLVHFPPETTGYAGIPFTGYNYFLHFLLSRLVLFYNFNVFDLYLRLFPALSFPLYGASIAVIASRLTKNKAKIFWAVFFLYFSQSLSLITQLVGKGVDPTIPTTVSFAFNQSLILSISLLAVVMVMLTLIKKNPLWAVYAGLVAGILAQIKAFSGILAIMLIVLFSLRHIITEGLIGKWRFMALLFIAGMLSVVTFLPMAVGTGGLVWAPLLIYEHFMDQPIMANAHWAEIKAVYLEHKNYFRLAQFFLGSIALFWTINLSLRLVILTKWKVFFKRDFWRDDLNFLMATLAIIPFILCSLFVQSPSAFEIKQFIWIGLIFMVVPTGLVVGGLLERRRGFVKFLLIALIIVFSVWDNFIVVKAYLIDMPKSIVNTEQLALYKNMEIEVPKNEYMVSVGFLNRWPYISAFSGRSFYFGEGTGSNMDSLGGLKFVRERSVKDLKEYIDTCQTEKIQSQLQTIGSNFVYLYYPSDCLATSSAVKKIFEAQDERFYVFK